MLLLSNREVHPADSDPNLQSNVILTILNSSASLSSFVAHLEPSLEPLNNLNIGESDDASNKSTVNDSNHLTTFCAPEVDGVTPGKLCGFCVKEFSKLEEFQNHMKCVGYICNNCLDFFSDMIWFPDAEADFHYIKTGAVMASTLATLPS